MIDDELLNQEYIYIISPFGLGDTYILCMLREAVEEYYRKNVVFIIKKPHKCIVELFEADYQIHEYSDEQLYRIASGNSKPCPGKRFVAHPHFNAPALEKDFFERKITFIQLYKRCLGLKDDAKIKPAHKYPVITQALIDKMYPFEIGDVVLFCPEMNSCRAAIDRPTDNWIKTYNDRIFENYENVVINTIDKSKHYKGKCLDLTLTELIVLAVNCKKVICVRSGLCDVIYTKVKDMNVIYTNVDFYYNYSLKNVFGIEFKNSNVSEKIISYANILYSYGYFNCSIYGMGENGKRLLHSLNLEKFPVCYGIDKQAEKIGSDIIIYKPEDVFPEVDCIVVTVYNGFEDICRILSEKNKYIPVINLYNMQILDTEQIFMEIG